MLIQEWLDAGIITPSRSTWASPVVVVSQTTEGGNIKHRLCGNYKKLNETMFRQNFPLPRAEDLMEEMRGSTIFSVIDLQFAYLQLPLAEEDKAKTAIITPDSHYQFNYLPFGLSIASQSMQRITSYLFSDLLDKYVKIFQDDLAVHSKSEAEHAVHVQEVLRRLAHAN